ncbi:hypothetical protein HOF65_02790 [bacterium]|jgi:hypothetical protein|nr:hypothetical protein [bacterium]MBT4633808.1 hypothetical protein [bacterium]MBT5491218.1 hypothetical protein [bacterium]MBT6779528.1 hypothetical protein [bacterium]
MLIITKELNTRLNKSNVQLAISHKLEKKKTTKKVQRTTTAINLYKNIGKNN